MLPQRAHSTSTAVSLAWSRDRPPHPEEIVDRVRGASAEQPPRLLPAQTRGAERPRQAAEAPMVKRRSDRGRGRRGGGRGRRSRRRGSGGREGGGAGGVRGGGGGGARGFGFFRVVQVGDHAADGVHGGVLALRGGREKKEEEEEEMSEWRSTHTDTHTEQRICSLFQMRTDLVGGRQVPGCVRERGQLLQAARERPQLFPEPVSQLR